eukprot:280600-Pleurochrysis_carterae.AAC.1
MNGVGLRKVDRERWVQIAAAWRARQQGAHDGRSLGVDDDCVHVLAHGDGHRSIVLALRRAEARVCARVRVDKRISGGGFLFGGGRTCMRLQGIGRWQRCHEKGARERRR